MNWVQLQIKATAKNAEFISDLLMTLGSEAVTLLDAKDQPLLEPGPGEMPLWDEAWVSGLFPEETDIDLLLKQLQIFLFDSHLEYRLVPLAEKNWTREWLTHFKPIKFGEKLWVTPEAYLADIQDKKAAIVVLDPGLAFGTGTHPTTALCLEWLEKTIALGQAVIDYGCGSGILAIAALKLGANVVYAIDNDPQALIATAENAKRNQINETHLVTLLPEHLQLIQTEILIANILANPLIELAPRFAELIKPQGQIALSGILIEQIESVVTAYQHFFELAEPQISGEWALISGKKLL